jgi:Leucine-rich repeat (LRR) protein
MKKILLFFCILVTTVLAGNTGWSILIIGDSNTEQGFITHSLADSLLAYVGASSSMGTGYIPINSGFYEVRDGRVPDVKTSYSDSWKLMDMFEGTRLPPPYLSPSGHWLVSSTAGAVATVTFAGNGVDVYWLSNTNGGEFSIIIDNVAKDTLNTNGSRSVQKTNIKGLNSGNHTMQLKVLSVPSSGNVTLLGFDGRNDISGITNRSVVHNWGNGYSASIDFMKIDSAVFATGLQKLDPDVVLLLIGTNDHLQDKRSAPEFKANLKVILNRIKAAGFENRVLLVSTYMTHTGDGSGAVFIPQYRATSWPEAAKETSVSYWDMSTWFGDDDAQWLYFDGCHCWDVCGKRIAPEMLRQIIARFPPITPHYRDSVSLAAILRANNLNLKTDAVSTWSVSGRIVALNLDSLNISVLPRDIGYMDSLKTIDLTGNRLISLPKEIITLAPSTNLLVDYNRLCTVSDTIKTWITKYSKNANWQNTQLADSLHYCNGGLVVGTAPWHKSIAAGSAGAFNTEVKGERMMLRFVDPSTVEVVTVMKLNGATLCRFGRVAGALSINLRDLPKSVVIVKVGLKGNGVYRTVVKRIPLF